MITQWLMGFLFQLLAIIVAWQANTLLLDSKSGLWLVVKRCFCSWGIPTWIRHFRNGTSTFE
jgi:hypothetical protein